MKKILLLGSGELGRELTISLKRLGCTVIAVDRYENAPAMQVADGCAVISMLDGEALARVVREHKPDLIIPEIEAIRTEKLREFEKSGITVIPTAEAAHLTMNRDAIRDLAARDLKLRTARYLYASSLEEFRIAAQKIGLPCVVKPIMSSSGKGQSVVRKASALEAAWNYAVTQMRGDQARVIIEEFIEFESEITLLTIRTRQGKTLFCPPIGHVQIAGDYRESWQPAALSAQKLAAAQAMAKKITTRLGGAGLFGVEFFLTKKEVIFSELSPRPHDTGMVTLISQNLTEFDLHARAALGLPIPEIKLLSAAASAVLLADRESTNFRVQGLEKALAKPGVDVRVFGKPSTRPGRRMAVALAQAKTTAAARKLAKAAAAKLSIEYGAKNV